MVNSEWKIGCGSWVMALIPQNAKRKTKSAIGFLCERLPCVLQVQGLRVASLRGISGKAWIRHGL
jgi:hypothetical protein